MSGDDVCCSVVFGTLVGVFVFSVMWSELLMTSGISCPLWSSVYECQRVECAFTSPVRTGLSVVQNLFLTAQSTQIKSVISVPIKDFIHHYPRALFNDIPRVGTYFYDIPGSGRTFTTYPGRGAV